MQKRKRGLSPGSVLMLVFVFVVLLFSFILMFRLTSGKRPEISGGGIQTQTDEGEPGGGSPSPAQQQTESAPASGEEQPQPVAGTSAATQPPSESPSSPAKMVLTVAGTLAIEKGIRQSSYAADTKVYDFTELLSLLKPEIRGDLNAVFLENLLMDDTKVSGLVVPACAAELLKESGFNVCLSGFPKAWEKKMEGILQTRSALEDRNISVLGLYDTGNSDHYEVREANGIRVALMQYASDVQTAVRKNMTKAGAEWAIPEADPEQIAKDIARAGAEAAVVFIHWGKVGGKNPEKAQRALAQQIADSGADVIIGAGSRIPQKPEYLTASDGRQVLCAYSLGTLMSDERSSANRIGSYLLHLGFEKESGERIQLKEVTYTPTYVWRYRQDSAYYYKCLAADRTPPDGMDSEQTRLMEKTFTTVQNMLEGSPAELRP